MQPRLHVARILIRVKFGHTSSDSRSLPFLYALIYRLFIIIIIIIITVQALRALLEDGSRRDGRTLKKECIHIKEGKYFLFANFPPPPAKLLNL